MHCVTFEGPGQGAVIREQQLPFRPDWEAVVTPVVDHVLTLPGVDPGPGTRQSRSCGLKQL